VKYFLLITFLFLYNEAFAITSERNFQAEAEKNVIQGNINYTKGVYDILPDGFGPGGDTDLTDIRYILSYERGFNANLAGYISLSYGVGELDFSDDDPADFEGLDPVSLGLKYQSVLDSGRFFARLNAAYGFEESKEDNRTYNAFSLNIKLGYEAFLNDENMIGLSGSYTVLSTDAKFEDDEDIGLSSPDEETDGNYEASIYFEHHNSAMGFVVGGHVDYELATLFDYVNFNFDGLDFDLVEFGVYGRYQFFDDTYLLGSFDYNFSVGEPEGIKSFDNFKLSFGVRALF